jgi:hypothetical protein
LQAARVLTSTEPAAISVLARQAAVAKALASTVPYAIGTLTYIHEGAAARSLVGLEPSAIGTLVRVAHWNRLTLVGIQPRATGALSIGDMFEGVRIPAEYSASEVVISGVYTASENRTRTAVYVAREEKM